MKNSKGQAIPPKTIFLSPSAFEDNGNTAVYWLGEAGVLINSRGTILMIDPVLSVIPASILPGSALLSEVNASPCLIEPPIRAAHVRRLDAVLYTHSDDDHMGVVTAPILRDTGCAYHATGESAAKLQALGVPAARICVHPRQDCFTVGRVRVEMTLANHPWQKSDPEVFHGWHFSLDDCTGYKLYTPDGVIWIPGDSLPMAEHSDNDDVDLLFADFSDDPFHYGARNMADLANRLSAAKLVAYHWGTLDLPNFLPQNADPYQARSLIEPPERLRIVAAGEAVIL